jgi:hypothetical protein
MAQNLLLRLPAVVDNAGMQAEPPKADPPKRKRRWFQFSLGTLLIGVTLLAIPCAWVGWQAKIIHRRKAMINKLTRMDGACLTVAQIAEVEPSHEFDDTTLKLPWIRKWLGDEPMFGLYIPESVPEADANEIASAFPEAVVSQSRMFPAY